MLVLNQAIKLSFVAILVFAVLIAATMSSAKLDRRILYDKSRDGIHGINRGMISTGDRAIVSVRGARNPHDETVPSKISIEKKPRSVGIYHRFDKFLRRRRFYPKNGFIRGLRGASLGGSYTGSLMGGVPHGYGRLAV